MENTAKDIWQNLTVAEKIAQLKMLIDIFKGDIEFIGPSARWAHDIQMLQWGIAK